LTKEKKQLPLRLRVFAGPNGSGKSTVIEQVKKYKSGGKYIDFGFFINADDIAVSLKAKDFSFAPYQITTTKKDFLAIAVASGLINENFSKARFVKSFIIKKNSFKLLLPEENERLAQIIADYLRKKLLIARKRFSFETVFSHSSKLDIMRQAAEAGYKVYLYYVSTESPTINIFRVAARAEQGGHDVPHEKIKSRYYRSLDLLYDASHLVYQAYYFDNSKDGEDFRMFAHFRKRKSKKKWDPLHKKEIPNWFKTYYLRKVLENAIAK